MNFSSLSKFQQILLGVGAVVLGTLLLVFVAWYGPQLAARVLLMKDEFVPVAPGTFRAGETVLLKWGPKGNPPSPKNQKLYPWEQLAIEYREGKKTKRVILLPRAKNIGSAQVLIPKSIPPGTKIFFLVTAVDPKGRVLSLVRVRSAKPSIVAAGEAVAQGFGDGDGGGGGGGGAQSGGGGGGGTPPGGPPPPPPPLPPPPPPPPTPPPDPGPAEFPAGWGVMIWGYDDREVAKFVEAGSQWVRFAIYLGEDEFLNERYDVDQWQDAFSRFRRAGLKTLVTIYGPPPTYGGLDPAEGRRRFATWARALARRYSGPDVAWEIWNEPNLPIFWPPDGDGRFADPPDPNRYCAGYAPLAIAMAQAIRQEHRSAIVVGPDPSPNGDTFDSPFMEACFRLGILQHLDGVSVHPYYGFQGGGPETVTNAEYDRLRGLIAQYAPRGKRIGLVSSEAGFPSADPQNPLPQYNEENQAKIVPRQRLYHLSQGVALDLYYFFRDISVTEMPGPEDWTHNSGLFRYYDNPANMVPKPAFFAARTVAGFLNGTTGFDRRITVGEADDYVLRFASPAGARLAAWTTSPSPRQLILPVAPGRYRLTNHLGDATQVVDVGPNGLDLVLTDAPQYIVPLP